MCSAQTFINASMTVVKIKITGSLQIQIHLMQSLTHYLKISSDWQGFLFQTVT